MSKINDSQELLRRYLAGELSPEEKAQVESWYQGFEDRAAGGDDPRIGPELRARVYWQLGLPVAGAVVRPLYLRWLRVAAAILLPVFGLSLFYVLKVRESAPDAVRWVSLSTRPGERKQVMLADSTEIWLNAASRLEYPENFGSGERLVRLSGEAFFKVRHDKLHPFRVLTAGQVYAHDLGTEFDVAAYAETQAVRVGVRSGQVAVGRNKKVWGQLAQGEGLAVDLKSWKTTRFAVAAADAGAWVNNELVVENQSLREVTALLGRSYGMSVKLAPGVDGGVLCRGRFNLKQQPAEIVGILCTLHGLSYTRTGNDILIKRRSADR